MVKLSKTYGKEVLGTPRQVSILIPMLAVIANPQPDPGGASNWQLCLRLVSRRYHSTRNHSRLAARSHSATGKSDCDHCRILVRFFCSPRHRSVAAIAF